MLTNQKIKLIQSLELKKFRTETGFFMVEGEKMVDELLNSRFQIEEIFALPIYSDARKTKLKAFNVSEVSEAQLKRISLLKTPNQVLALVQIPKTSIKAESVKDELIIALDQVQDPGNLGTIVRTASWFGIKHIVCSHNTVDVYNPKVVQATMGALFNTMVDYVDLPEFLTASANLAMPLYATSLQGDNIYATPLSANGIIVMGNESVGVSEQVFKLVNHKLFIPKYGDAPNTESLNVSIATALVCAEFKRRTISIQPL